jgi:hypothetical protein
MCLTVKLLKKTGLDLPQNNMSKLTQFRVWECNSNYSLKYFLLKNNFKQKYFIFKKNTVSTIFSDITLNSE